MCHYLLFLQTKFTCFFMLREQFCSPGQGSRVFRTFPSTYFFQDPIFYHVLFFICLVLLYIPRLYLYICKMTIKENTKQENILFFGMLVLKLVFLCCLFHFMLCTWCLWEFLWLKTRHMLVLFFPFLFAALMELKLGLTRRKLGYSSKQGDAEKSLCYFH